MEYASPTATTQPCIAKRSDQTAKDLDKATLGVFGLGSMAEYATREFLRTSGVDPAGVKFVEIGPAAMATAIQRGIVAAGVVSEPNLPVVAENDVVPFTTVYDNCPKFFYINSWFANREWLAKNADTVRRLIAAIYDTARWANTHRADTATILAKWAKLDIERIRRMNRAIYDTALDPKKLKRSTSRGNTTASKTDPRKRPDREM